jgi:hypothetical protein
MSHLFPVKPACFWLVVAFLFVFDGRLWLSYIFVPDFSVAQFNGPNNEIMSTSTPTDGGDGGGGSGSGVPTVVAAMVLATRQQTKQRQ